jgi:hypothetical protein
MPGARKRASQGVPTSAAAGRARAAPRSAAARVDGSSQDVHVDLGARIARLALILVLLLAPLVVDTSAEAAFDAPKRLLMLLGVTIAAAAALILAPPAASAGAALRTWRAATPGARAIALLALLTVGLAVAAALLSPRASLSIRALGVLLPLALLLPLGASRVLDAGGSASLLTAFVAGASVDALLSILERLGLLQLFAVESAAGRGGTGALVGNEGSLALLLALAAVASLAVLLRARDRAWRVAAGTALVVLAFALAMNASLTALLALLVGAAVVATCTLGRRALLVVAGAIVLIGLSAVAVPQLRGRVASAAAAVRAGDWDELLTYRLGPWAAAAEMVRARPLVGFGPGTFAAEFVAQRLAAEQRHQRRFVLPRETSTFGEAHDEYLQLAAEIGLPAAVAALAALGLLLSTLLRRITSADAGADGGAHDEAVLILALLVTGATAALTWFPLQLAVTAPALLLALGRGWRLLAAGAATPAVIDVSAALRVPTPAAESSDLAAIATHPAFRALRTVAALALVAIVGIVELRRYGAERDLARATSAVQGYVATRGIAPPHVLDEARARALASAGALPNDPRPLLAAAGVDLVAKRPQDALVLYRAALALGERAETDLNAGRAFAMLDQRGDAFAAFVRAAWLSPALVPAMPTAAQPLVQQETARLAETLQAGERAAPPPLPDALHAPSPR